MWRGNYLWDLLVSNIMLMIGRIIGSKSILVAMKIYLALNTAGVELIQCHWNVIFEISLSSIDWVINTNTSRNVGIVGIESEGFCVRFWEPEGWVDFGRRPIEMQKRKLSMEQLKVWLKNEKLSSSNQIIPRHISHHEISMEKRRTLFSCGGEAEGHC